MRRRYILAAMVVIAIIVVHKFRKHFRFPHLLNRFTPMPLLSCGSAHLPEYAVDETGRGAAGTVARGPYYPGIHRGVATNGSAEHFHSRPGTEHFHSRPGTEHFHSRPGAEHFHSRPGAEHFHSRPVRPSHAHVAGSKDTDAGPVVSNLAALTRRSASSGATRACSRTFSDISMDADLSLEGLHESDTSRMMCERGSSYADSATNRPGVPDFLKIGLGSVVQDPRFQPGDPRWLESDGNPAPGTHAGSVSLGALTPAAFERTGAWDATRTMGFGPRGKIGNDPVRDYEALVTNMA